MKFVKGKEKVKSDYNKRGIGRLKRDWERKCNFREEKQYKYVCICTEGTETEKSYFDCVENVFKKERKIQEIDNDIGLRLVYVMSKKTAPFYLRKKIEKKLTDLDKEKGGYDSAWIISDYDSWKQDELKEMEKWQKEDVQKRHWILSNKAFEKWLEYHFKDNGSQQIFFKRYYTNDNYYKKIKNNDFIHKQIIYACKKARGKKQKISDLYTQEGSLMYEIVEFIGEEYGLCSKDSRGVVSWKRTET